MAINANVTNTPGHQRAARTELETTEPLLGDPRAAYETRDPREVERGVNGTGLSGERKAHRSGGRVLECPSRCRFDDLPRSPMTEILETPVLGCLLPTAATEPPMVSVVVPTRNEAENVEPLVCALTRALWGIRAEVLFVDDSDDDTGDRIRDVAMVWTHPDFEIRLL